MTKKYTFADEIFERLCGMRESRTISIEARKIRPPSDENDLKIFAERRRSALRNLERRGLIKLTQYRGFIRIQFTVAGQHERMLRAVAQQQKQLPRGSFCYVVFDIPETRRIARRAFVRFLKAAHFVKLQKSVWRTQYDARRELRELVPIHRVGTMIKVIVGKELI